MDGAGDEACAVDVGDSTWSTGDGDVAATAAAAVDELDVELLESDGEDLDRLPIPSCDAEGMRPGVGVEVEIALDDADVDPGLRIADCGLWIVDRGPALGVDGSRTSGASRVRLACRWAEATAQRERRNGGKEGGLGRGK